MKIKDLLEALQFPEKGSVDKKIFKKAIYENADLSKKQAELIKSEVNDIRWQYILKPETINIRKFKDEDFEYEEIQVLSASLKTSQKVSDIADIIQRAIPYPVILFLHNEDSVAISVATKRINKADVSKSVIDEAYMTEWISNIQGGTAKAFIKELLLEKLSFTNLLEFYSDFADRVKAFCVCEYMKHYKYKDKSTTAKLYQSYQKIKELEEQKITWRRQIKNEADFARKVNLNVAVKKTNQKIQTYRENLNLS